MQNLIDYTLSNGVRVLIVPQKESLSAGVAILVKAGSAYETKEINGISHFLEHMCFKGTTSRPTPLIISSEFEQMGSLYNAFTSRDYTGYHGRVAARNFEKMFDLLADMYFNPVVNEKELEKEKGVIVEEINMYEDNPAAKVGELLTTALYGDQPAGWDIAGTHETVRAVTREAIIRYRSKHYRGAKTIVVIAGNVDATKTKALVKKYFSKLERGVSTKAGRVAKHIPQTLIHERKLDQTHISLGFDSFPATSPKWSVSALMTDVLGGGMSSRLFQRVREELGAAYYVGADDNLYGTHGFIDISAGLNHGKTLAVAEAIREEVEKMRIDLITEHELKRVKDHTIGTLLISLDTPDRLASFYGRQAVFEKKLDRPSDVVTKLKKVTAADIRRLMRELVTPARMAIAAVGPNLDKVKLEKALRGKQSE